MEKRFSTRHVAARDRVAYWSEVLRGAYVAMDCNVSDKASFSADMHVRRFGHLSLSRFTYDPLTLTRGDSHIRRTDNELVLFGFQLRGHRHIEQDGRAAEVSPGDVAVFDSTRPCEIRFGDHSEALSAHLPREQFIRRMGRTESFTAKRLSGQNPLVGTVRRFLVDLHTNVDNRDPTIAARLEECGIELLLTALTFENCEATPQPVSRVASLYRLKSFIDTHLHDNRLTPGQVAAACNVSPRHQRSLFAAEGSSPANYIWSQRLRRCKRDLADPRLSHRQISDIAYAWGFGNMTHFSHIFRKSEGITAREYREKHAISGA